MYSDKGLRYWGLVLAGAGASGLLVCLAALVVPGLAEAAGPWLAGLGGSLVVVLVMAGDTWLAWRERRALVEQTETINYERRLRNLERAGRFETPPPKDERDYGPEWFAEAYKFLAWGDSLGTFTARKMFAAGAVKWDDWTPLKDYCVELSVLTGSGLGTRWADGWDWQRWLEERGKLPRPSRRYPPPSVAILIQRPTPHTPPTAEMVGEGD